jgi:transketolase
VTYAFLSDGEMEEGQVWEAAMFAAHHQHRLGRLVVMVDANDSQVDGPVHDVTTLEPLPEKWRAFGWRAVEVDGHDADALYDALGTMRDGGAPSVVIARTHIVGGMRSLPSTLDGHFLKLDAATERALVQELEASLA